MTLKDLDEIKKNYKVLEIAVDFINPSYNISRAKHLDNARYIVCTLTENGVPRNVKSNEVTRIRLQKPDKQPVYNDCDVIEDGRVLITLTEQILAVEGNAVCDIQLTNEETGIIYSTKNFIINIDKTAVDNSVIESSYEFDALNNLIATHKKINDELEQNEIIRKINEADRVSKENVRKLNEDKRIEAENTRIENETKRISAESIRESNEKTRVSQENNRQKNTSTAISNAESATKRANDAADRLQEKLDSHYFVLTSDIDTVGGVAGYDTLNELDSTIITNSDIDELFT